MISLHAVQVVVLGLLAGCPAPAAAARTVAAAVAAATAASITAACQKGLMV